MAASNPISLELIEGAVVTLRGHRVLLDESLAVLYGVSVRALNQAVGRNLDRFPEDFAFRLTLDEAQRSRSQFVILNDLTTGKYSYSIPRPGGRQRGTNIKYLPYAFTEQGVAMLSSVLRSRRAVQVNIEVMRAFVRLRRILSGHEVLAKKVAELEEKYDGQFRVVFDAIHELMTPPPGEATPIGFRSEPR